MYPADTNYAQETVESPIFHLCHEYDVSLLLTYGVFGDVYSGLNDFIELYKADPAVVGINLFGTYPGPGTFDN